MHILEALKEKRALLKFWCALVLIISFLLFVLCLIFFGSAYNNQTRVYKLNVYCVDLDGGLVGSAFLEACKLSNAAAISDHPTLRIATFSSLSAVVAALHEGDAWGAMVVQEGSTAMLLNVTDQIALGEEVDGYNASGVGVVMYDEGRNAASINTFVTPFMVGFMRTFTSAFAANYWAATLASPLFVNVSASSLSIYSSIVTQPIGYTIWNLHPVTLVGVSAQQIGLIYLVVFSFLYVMASAAFVRPIASSISNIFERWIFLALNAIIVTFILSLFYSSTVAIYSAVPAEKFVSYWMLNWLQQSLYCMSLLLTFPLVKERLGFLFVCYLILNVTSAFQNVVIENDFYEWSYATPFYHSIAATRYLLFGSYNMLTTNIPVLVGEWVLAALLLLGMVTLNEKVLVPRGMGLGPTS